MPQRTEIEVRDSNPINRITGDIIESAMRIHTELGPGLLESVYSVILARDLTRRGYRVEHQKPVSFEFDGMRFENAFVADLVVDGWVVVEVKAASQLAAVHARQLLTYLRLLECPIGLVLNFGSTQLRDGLKRVLNPAAPLPRHSRSPGARARSATGTSGDRIESQVDRID